MTTQRNVPKEGREDEAYRFPHRHLLGIEGLSPDHITLLLDLADSYVEQNRRPDKKSDVLRGRTVINLLFENSTRTRTSFELADNRLSADVINTAVVRSENTRVGKELGGSVRYRWSPYHS